MSYERGCGGAIASEGIWQGTSITGGIIAATGNGEGERGARGGTDDRYPLMLLSSRNATRYAAVK